MRCSIFSSAVALACLGCGPAMTETDAGVDSGPARDAGDAPALIELTFDGCALDFSGMLLVGTTADSISVVNATATTMDNIQLALPLGMDTLVLSTMQRTDTNTIVNIVDGTTSWTNSNVFGASTDPVSGTIFVHALDYATGVSDLDFSAVTLVDVMSGSICTVNGSVQTFRAGL